MTKCPTCPEEVKGFKDKLSYKEFLISGMCQKCQDKVFNVEEEGLIEPQIHYVDYEEDFKDGE